MAGSKKPIAVTGVILLAALFLPALRADDFFTVALEAKILIVLPDDADRLETYAGSELGRHVQAVMGAKPTVLPASRVTDRDLGRSNVIALGRPANHRLLKSLCGLGFIEPNQTAQGYSMRIDVNPHDAERERWLAVLCGADSLGVLYAVRDFCRYQFCRDGGRVVLRPTNRQFAPRIKARILSESGCNLFGKRDCKDHASAGPLNTYFLDWLSEWKATHVLVWWRCQKQYDPLWGPLIEAAHARGLKVLRGFVPYRPDHEGAPEKLKAYKPRTGSTELANCPCDPAAREWYTQHLIELVTREPRIDGVVIESPYHDGVCCTCPPCTKDPVPETEMMEHLFAAIRKARPDVTLGRCVKRPVPDETAARRLAKDLAPLDAYVDWYYNTYRDRADRKRWHAIGPKCATYLRTYRSALKGRDVAKEIEFLFNDFRMSAERNVVAHGFCYRFYGGRYGSWRVEDDRAVLEANPGKKGPLSLALVCEAAFDPFVEGAARARKIDRIRALTVEDYPRQTGPKLVTPMTAGGTWPKPSNLFSYAYGIRDTSFCGAQVCVDLDNDGKREIPFGSRATKSIHLLSARDGKVIWTRKIPGDYQATTAYDLDGDDVFEILYTTSSPGRLYVLNKDGKILKVWDSGDYKLGNMPVVLDGDGDGVLDAYFGSRSRYFVRLNARDVSTILKRSGWVQCGCQTSAMDVDGDGTWDIFAGCGDDRQMQGALHCIDPVTLRSRWSYKVGGNGSSADPVLADIDGDGRVEIIKSVDDYAGDSKTDAIYAFRSDGTLLWRTGGLAGEDTPNVGDLDGDGRVEIVGMTFGNEVYCLDAKGRVRWRRDLRPELDDGVHAYMAPILCDLNGDERLEILAMTNGRYFEATPTGELKGNGILFALSADGEVLDRFDVGGPRYWGYAFVCNVDDDPTLELAVSGSGGLDVIKTKGLGPNTEHFQRRRSYRRLNVIPWAYEDEYFIYRGQKQGVTNRTDNLVLPKVGNQYRSIGRFITERLVLPPGCRFDRLSWRADTPSGTEIIVNVLADDRSSVVEGAKNGQRLGIDKPVRLSFILSTDDRAVTPRLDGYSLRFRREEP